MLGPCQRAEEAFREEAVVVLPMGSLRCYICSKYSSFPQLPAEPSLSSAKAEPTPAAEQCVTKPVQKSLPQVCCSHPPSQDNLGGRGSLAAHLACVSASPEGWFLPQGPRERIPLSFWDSLGYEKTSFCPNHACTEGCSFLILHCVFISMVRKLDGHQKSFHLPPSVVTTCNNN